MFLFCMILNFCCLLLFKFLCNSDTNKNNVLQHILQSFWRNFEMFKKQWVPFNLSPLGCIKLITLPTDNNTWLFLHRNAQQIVPVKLDYKKQLIPFVMITSERPKSKYWPIPNFRLFRYRQKDYRYVNQYRKMKIVIQTNSNFNLVFFFSFCGEQQLEHKQEFKKIFFLLKAKYSKKKIFFFFFSL